MREISKKPILIYKISTSAVNNSTLIVSLARESQNIKNLLINNPLCQIQTVERCCAVIRWRHANFLKAETLIQSTNTRTNTIKRHPYGVESTRWGSYMGQRRGLIKETSTLVVLNSPVIIQTWICEFGVRFRARGVWRWFRKSALLLVTTGGFGSEKAFVAIQPIFGLSV